MPTPPENSRQPRPNHVIDEAAIGRWVSGAIEGCAGAEVTVRQFRGGQSNPTYWVGVTAGSNEVELVLRKKPPGNLLPSAHAIEREYRVMRALRDTPVPVPDALALCEDASIIGTPFFVMRYVPGRIFWDPSLPDFPSADARRHVYRAYVDVLTKLHAVDVAKVGLSDYGKVGGYVPRQVERWSKQYEASKTEEVASMEALMAWLKSRTPSTDETTLIHGDYRIDNLMFSRGERLEPLALLDWELSTLGHPMSDLAYACMAYHLVLPGRGGLAGVDVASIGIPTEDELVAEYCAKTGRTRADDWDYFMAFGIFRLAAIAQGAYKRSLQGNASSEDASGFGAAADFLAQLACSIAKIPIRGNS